MFILPPAAAQARPQERNTQNRAGPGRQAADCSRTRGNGSRNSGQHLEGRNVCLYKTTQQLKCYESCSDAKKMMGWLWAVCATRVSRTHKTPPFSKTNLSGHSGGHRHLLAVRQGWVSKNRAKGQALGGEGARLECSWKGSFTFIRPTLGVSLPIKCSTPPHPPHM